jgi:hypothetical protein
MVVWGFGSDAQTRGSAICCTTLMSVRRLPKRCMTPFVLRVSVATKVSEPRRAKGGTG